jgi:hypothetical protein
VAQAEQFLAADERNKAIKQFENAVMGASQYRYFFLKANRPQYAQHFKSLVETLEAKTDRLKQELQPEPNALKEKLAKKISVELTDTPLEDAVGFLRQLTQLNLILDPKLAAQDRPITIKVTDMPISTFLEWVAKLSGAQLTYKENAVFLTLPKDAPAAPVADQAGTWVRHGGSLRIKLGADRELEAPVAALAAFPHLAEQMLQEVLVDFESGLVVFHVPEGQYEARIRKPLLDVFQGKINLYDEGLLVLLHDDPKQLRKAAVLLKALGCRYALGDRDARRTRGLPAFELALDAAPPGQKDLEEPAPQLDAKQPDADQLIMQYQQALQKKVSLELVDTPMRDGVRLLQAATGVPFTLPEHHGDHLLNLRVTDLLAVNALEFMLKLGELNHRITAKGVLIGKDKAELDALEQGLQIQKPPAEPQF